MPQEPASATLLQTQDLPSLAPVQANPALQFPYTYRESEKIQKNQSSEGLCDLLKPASCEPAMLGGVAEDG